jgi:hypothetical protein
MQSLNELIAHNIECVHASMSIRKQGELVCLNKYSKKTLKKIFLSRMVQE